MIFKSSADNIAIDQHSASLDQLILNMNKSMDAFNNYCLLNANTKFILFSIENVAITPIIFSNDYEIEYVYIDS